MCLKEDSSTLSAPSRAQVHTPIPFLSWSCHHLTLTTPGSDADGHPHLRQVRELGLEGQEAALELLQRCGRVPELG